MTWRRVALYYVLFAAAALWYYRGPAGTETEGMPAEERTLALVDLPLDRVEQVDLVRQGQRVRFRPHAGRWQIVEPQARAPADLLWSFVATLVEARAAEVIADGRTDENAYGLGLDALRVELYERGHERPVRVIFGNRNPTETAVYARVEGRPETLLVGRVLQYYAERILEEAARGEEPAPPVRDADQAERAP
jgi:hypothetical protein